jgi:hypothetical protein
MVDIELVRRRLYGSVNRIRWSTRDIAQIMKRFGATGLEIPHAGQSPMRCEAPASEVMKDSGISGTYTFTISTNAVDRSGDTINQSGWVLSAFRANPVTLWSHSTGLLPVGRTTRLWLDGGQLKATVQLAPADANPSDGQVRLLLDGGFVGAASVGFLPLRFEFSNDPTRKFGIDFEQTELVEWSICNIPANRECLIDPGQGSKAVIAAQSDARRRLELDLLKIGGKSATVAALPAKARRLRDLMAIRARSR